MFTKKWFSVLFIAMASVLCAFPAEALPAAGSCTFSMTGKDTLFPQYTWVCTSDGAGDVSDPTITGDNYNQKVSGSLVYAKIIPGTGADAPDALYDVSLLDASDLTVDYIGDIGDNLSQTVTKLDTPYSSGGFTRYLKNVQLVPFAGGCGAGNKFTLTILTYTGYERD